MEEGGKKRVHSGEGNDCRPNRPTSLPPKSGKKITNQRKRVSTINKHARGKKFRVGGCNLHAARKGAPDTGSFFSKESEEAECEGNGGGEGRTSEGCTPGERSLEPLGKEKRSR